MGNISATGRETEPEKIEPSAAEIAAHLSKILNSQALGSSELLRRLLSFYAQRSLEGLAPKEYEIATQGLGRSPDFDPRADSTVRVQTGRLRSKLAEYYLHEGAGDAVLLEIPKGSYHLEWRYRDSATTDPPRVLAAPPQPKNARSRWVIPAAVAGVICVTALLFLIVRNGPKRSESELRTFWQSFTNTADTPLVVFSNPRFVGSPGEALRYFRQDADAAETIDDTYTGTGEVMAVHQLTKTFSLFRKGLRVKRAQLLTWDEAKQSDFIFIGSPQQNLPVGEVQWLKEFRFKPQTIEPRVGYVGIINERPRAGEEPLYFGSTSKPARYDYGVVALVPGVSPDRHALVLAGTTTLGTQGAAEFVCSREGIAELLRRMEVPNGTRMPLFEAIVHVRINGGVPVDTRLLLVHVRPGRSAR